MTEAAAISSGRRCWPRRSRLLIQYLLLQPVIIVLCLIVLRVPPPEPSSRWLVTDFTLREAGVERAVTLPHFNSSRYAMNDPPLYTGRFTRPADEAQQAWSPPHLQSDVLSELITRYGALADDTDMHTLPQSIEAIGLAEVD